MVKMQFAVSSILTYVAYEGGLCSRITYKNNYKKENSFYKNNFYKICDSKDKNPIAVNKIMKYLCNFLLNFKSNNIYKHKMKKS